MLLQFLGKTTVKFNFEVWKWLKWLYEVSSLLKQNFVKRGQFLKRWLSQEKRGENIAKFNFWLITYSVTISPADWWKNTAVRYKTDSAQIL